MHFIKWLSEVRKFQIKDHLNLDSCTCSGPHFQQIVIDDNGNEKNVLVEIYPSDPKHLERITTIKDHGRTIKVYPVSAKYQSQIDSWCDDPVNRFNVCQRAILQLLSEEKFEAAKHFSKVKNQRRLEALKMMLPPKPMNPDPNTKFRYYLVLEWAKSSFLILFQEILPLLISGIPIMIVVKTEFAMQVSYLRTLLISSGAPESIFRDWIVHSRLEFDLGNKYGVYLLTGTADIYSSWENMLDNFLMSNLTCIVVFAQESLKSKIQKIIEPKLEKSTRLLFSDKEFFPTKMNGSIDLDSLSFVKLNHGIHFHYFRHLDESIKMIDHFVGLNEQRKFPPIPISIWSEETGIAIKMATQIQNTLNISINCSSTKTKLNSDDHHVLQWPFELLVGHQSYEKFIKDTNLNLKKPNTSWPSLNNRAQLLIEMLNKCNKNEEQMAKFPNEQFVRMIFECHSSGGDSQHLFKDFNDRNLLQLDYKSPPLGNFIVHLGDDNDEDVLSCDVSASHSSLLSIFFLTLLLHGNFLTLIGTKDALKHWKPMVEHLNSNPNGQNVMQMIVARNHNNVDEDDDQNVDGFFMVPNKWTNQVDDGDDDDQEDACLLLLSEKGHIQSVFIDQSHYIKHKAMDNYWMLQQNLLKWLQNGRLNCSISIALQEFDMKKMVE